MTRVVPMGSVIKKRSMNIFFVHNHSEDKTVIFTARTRRVWDRLLWAPREVQVRRLSKVDEPSLSPPSNAEARQKQAADVCPVPRYGARWLRNSPQAATSMRRMGRSAFVPRISCLSLEVICREQTKYPRQTYHKMIHLTKHRNNDVIIWKS